VTVDRRQGGLGDRHRGGAPGSELRADYETLQAMGDTGYAPTVAALLAEVLQAQGRDREAEELARESVRLIGTTDQPDVQGQAMAGLAQVLEAAGRGLEAEAALRDAVALFAAKGNAVAAARARRELERLEGSPANSAPAPL